MFFKLIFVVVGQGIPCGIALKWLSFDRTDDKSTLVQVMAWCRQATSHYMSQFDSDLCRQMASLGHTELMWRPHPARTRPPFHYQRSTTNPRLSSCGQDHVSHFILTPHWNRNVCILTKCSSLLAQEVIKMTTSGAVTEISPQWYFRFMVACWIICLQNVYLCFLLSLFADIKWHGVVEILTRGRKRVIYLIT